MRSKRRGFTLIELLVVIVVIGILATFSLASIRQTRGRAVVASMHSDLRNVAVAQEGFLAEHGSYAGDLAQLPVHASPGVTIAVSSTDASGWSATATHPAALLQQCAVFHGQPGAVPSPAVAEGVIGCQ